MRRPSFDHLKVLLALVPLLSQRPSSVTAAVAGFWIALAILGVTSFFSLTAPLFPKKLIRFAMILFVAAIYQTLHYFISIPAIYLVSFFLLFDWNDVDKNRLGQKNLPLAPRLLVFAGSALILGILQDLLAQRFGAALFRQPPRLLALLSLWALGFQKFFPLRTRKAAA
jgi:hypothetical protein